MFTRSVFLALLVVLVSMTIAPGAEDFRSSVQPFLRAHCVRCHGADKQSGDVRLDDLPSEVGQAVERWTAVRDQLRDGLMPPRKQPRPDASQARGVVAWVTARVGIVAPKLPNQGNLVPHEILFDRKPAPSEPLPGRVWRLSPTGYTGWLTEVHRSRLPALTQPFTMTPERGIRDFAGLYTIDEPATEILLRNAEAVVEAQTAHEIKDGKAIGKRDAVADFVRLMAPALAPAKAQLEAAVQTQFRLAIGRRATAEEISRFVGLYEKCAASGDRPGAVKTMLQAILLKTDAMYRSEFGAGKGLSRMLAPEELARAISLSLGDRREKGLMAAVQEGKLTTRQQVASHVRRILDDPKAAKPHFLQFFREYFEYHKAPDVFKDKPKDFTTDPRVMVSDTDQLVEHILAADKDVFRELLTTPRTFVNLRLRKNKRTGEVEQIPAQVLNYRKDKGQKKPLGLEYIYGFEAFPGPQPVEVPGGIRLGILMQPSWLVAWSTNFNNDPVRRGRWIRERLLGGTVPDLPIGVAAQIPDEPEHTLRHRLRVTRQGRCWTCHQKMDDLGLSFEQFDHYGRFRTAEAVLDPKATANNVDAKSKKPLGPVYRGEKLDTSGRIADSGDPALDGAIRDPRQLVRKVANSERCRQVFVRHAFRYFLGRNETLSDARTLQAADRAYVESGGSFKALVVALLTSDSFLYRSASIQGDHR